MVFTRNRQLSELNWQVITPNLSAIGRDKLARAEIATCAISGAVGTFANIDPSVEEHVAKALGLTPETVSTQTIPRDRHAVFFGSGGGRIFS